MIKLKEILHRLHAENEQGLTEVDSWKITDADYLTDMGFTIDGMYHFGLKKPEIKIAHKKGQGFIVEDMTKNRKQVFPKFTELMEYFSKYQQRWEREPYSE
jgi:hypothetical protein